jgi:hexokinase
MSTTQQYLDQLHTDFTFSAAQLTGIVELFLHDMKEGLQGQASSLAMLPSFLTKPTGQETGIFLALDFGGTNVRVMLIELTGHGSYTILKRQDVPLSDQSKNYDFTSRTSTAAELFGFLADQLAQLTQPDKTYLLGHTFSFPCRQTGTNQAILLHWTKEINTSGVVGHNVVDLLHQALAARSLSNIHPVTITNDTVSALLAAAYQDCYADIGSICGTGHNTCYLELKPPRSSHPMYINIESGNFDKISGNKYDALLDQYSSRPGAGKLEKMCAGRYIGELLRLVLLDAVTQGLLFNGNCPVFLQTVGALSGWDVAVLQDAVAEPEQISLWLAKHSSPTAVSLDDREVLQHSACLIATRSARLAAASYAAILKHIDPTLNSLHTISIDGSLYEKLPGYASTISQTLQELVGVKAGQIKCVLTKDGSGIGAAIAAATTKMNGGSQITI